MILSFSTLVTQDTLNQSVVYLSVWCPNVKVRTDYWVHCIPAFENGIFYKSDITINFLREHYGFEEIAFFPCKSLRKSLNYS